MPLAKLDTGFNIEVDFAIAPFHKRFFAWIIDLMLLWLYVKLVATLSGIPSFFIWIFGWSWKAILLSFPILFYHLFCEVTFNGKSLGKLAMNIQVITAEGGQPTLGQYLIRWSFRLIDFPILLI